MKIMMFFFVLFLMLFKWCTCQLKYPCGDLDSAFNDLIECLEKSHKNHAVLPVASAVSSRTKYLLGGGGKPSLCIEAERRKTFMSWPHKEYRFVIMPYVVVVMNFVCTPQEKEITLLYLEHTPLLTNKPGSDVRFTTRKREIWQYELGVELCKTFTKKTIFNKI